MKAKVLVGVSGSGKSTIARELCKEGYIALDRDDLRFSLRKANNWGEYRFDKKVERMITNAHENMVHTAYGAKFNIVIAETNLNPRTRARWQEFLFAVGYEVEFVPIPIKLEEAIERDANRQYSVGEAVIRKQWEQWITYIGSDHD